MLAVKSATDFPIDDLGGFLIVIFCLMAIVFGRDSATINAVLFTVIGKMFGKYQKKRMR